MDKRIIIIHPSEIVRKGLQSILRDAFEYEFILLENLNHLNDYSALTGYDLILLIDFNLKTTFLKNNNTLLTKNNHSVFAFYIGYEPQINTSDYININHQGIEIISLMKKCITPDEPKNNTISELSDRELDVLQLVALGFQNKDIAEKLFISIHTVITHRKHITEKLGIKSISGLTVYAILNKLIDTDNIDPATLI